jgi:hypothetical protein
VRLQHHSRRKCPDDDATARRKILRFKKTSLFDNLRLKFKKSHPNRFWCSWRTSSTTYHRTRGAAIFRVLPPTTTERLCQLLSFRTLTRATRGRNRPCGVSTRIVHRSTSSRSVESRPRYHTSRRGDHRPIFISLPSRIGIFLITGVI